MNFSLRQLRGFLAVAEHASFTKAAAQLHVTQAGLSAMVREFEQTVECRLFERSTRAVLLTDAGRTLLPVAQRTVDELGETMRQLAAANKPQARVLRVGVTPLIASSILPQVLRAYAEAQPEWRVEVADMDRGLIQQGVEDGTLDAGFGAFFQKAAGLRRRGLFLRSWSSRNRRRWPPKRAGLRCRGSGWIPPASSCCRRATPSSS